MHQLWLLFLAHASSRRPSCTLQGFTWCRAAQCATPRAHDVAEVHNLRPDQPGASSQLYELAWHQEPNALHVGGRRVMTTIAWRVYCPKFLDLVY